MLTQQQITVAADRLYQAEKEHEQIKALTMSFNMDMDDAYAIQKAWIDRRLQDGEKIIGYKIGLTSRTMQVAMNINTPDYGVLTDAMLFPNKSRLWTPQIMYSPRSNSFRLEVVGSILKRAIPEMCVTPLLTMRLMPA